MIISGGGGAKAAFLLALATASAAAGGLAFLPPAASSVSASQRTQMGQLLGETDTAKVAPSIVGKYGQILALGVVAAPKPIAKSRAVDPIDTVRLAGVVEKDGVPMAVFFAGIENAETVITLRRGERLFASWTLQQFDASSATLVQGNAQKTLRLFE